MRTGIYYIGILVLTFFYCANSFSQKAKVKEAGKLFYTNPIIDYGLADPNIKFENGYYYLLATGKAPDGRFIPIYRSKNLVTWQFVSGAVDRGEKTDWNYKNFWAPEVYKIKGKFYLYYTAMPEVSPSNSGNRVGLAVSDSIQGPYKNVGVVVPHASLDGHLFFDIDGSMYIYYTIEHGNKDGLTAGQIYADKLITPTQVAGKPVQIISNHPWQEGPFMLHRNDKYYLTYSCGNWMGQYVSYSLCNFKIGNGAIHRAGGYYFKNE